MIKNTGFYSSMPITAQAGLRLRKLALHSNRSYGYAFRSRAALTNTNPAPAPVILVRNAGLGLCCLKGNRPSIICRVGDSEQFLDKRNKPFSEDIWPAPRSSIHAGCATFINSALSASLRTLRFINVSRILISRVTIGGPGRGRSSMCGCH